MLKTAIYEKDQIMQIWKRLSAKGPKKSFHTNKNWKMIKSYSRPNNRQAYTQTNANKRFKRLWLYRYDLIHINNCIPQMLFFGSLLYRNGLESAVQINSQYSIPLLQRVLQEIFNDVSFDLFPKYSLIYSKWIVKSSANYLFILWD